MQKGERKRFYIQDELPYTTTGCIKVLFMAIVMDLFKGTGGHASTLCKKNEESY